jgi:hypothetical protein
VGVTKKLKLFVWSSFAFNWTAGLAFAIAANEADARKAVMATDPEVLCGDYGMLTSGDKSAEEIEKEWGPVQVFPLGSPIAFAVTGGS